MLSFSEKTACELIFLLATAIAADLDACNPTSALLLAEHTNLVASQFPRLRPAAAALLARCHLLLGQPHAAVSALSTLDAGVKNSLVSFLHASALVSLNCFYDAECILLPYTERNDEVGSLDETKEAFSDLYSSRLLRAPDFCEFFHLRGVICMKTQRPDLARELFLETLALNPFKWSAATFLLQLGHFTPIPTVDLFPKPRMFNAVNRLISNLESQPTIHELPSMIVVETIQSPTSPTSPTTPSKRVTPSTTRAQPYSTPLRNNVTPLASANKRTRLVQNQDSFCIRRTRNSQSHVSYNEQGTQYEEQATSFLQAPQLNFDANVAASCFSSLFATFTEIEMLSRTDTPAFNHRLKELPLWLRSDPLIKSTEARTAHEDSSYELAAELWKEMRLSKTATSARVRDMDMYSTSLWFLRREAELTALCAILRAQYPRAPETWIAIGNLCSLQNDPASALQAFDRSAQLDPSYAYAHNLMGHEFVMCEKFESAKIAFRRALAADLRCSNAWYGLGLMYHEEEQLDAALYHYRRAAELSKNPVVQKYIGNVLFAKRDYEAAVAVYDASLLRNPDNSALLLSKAAALIQMGRIDSAHSLLKSMESKFSNEANLHYLLGRIAEKNGDVSECIRYLNLAVSQFQGYVPTMLQDMIDDVVNGIPLGDLNLERDFMAVPLGGRGFTID